MCNTKSDFDAKAYRQVWYAMEMFVFLIFHVIRFCFDLASASFIRCKHKIELSDVASCDNRKKVKWMWGIDRYCFPIKKKK